MLSHVMSLAFVSLFGLSVIATCSVAADPLGTADSDDMDRAEAFLRQARKAAAGYHFTRKDGKELVLREEPTLTWSNPVVGEVYGADFVWTHQGRPEMIASFFRWHSPNTGERHEFHSLALQPIRASNEGATVWEIDGPGVNFTAMPPAQAPAKTAAGRLIQMKRIAREFSAVRLSGDREFELRLLAQPMFRYTTEDGGERAMFAFVEATDPDVILLLEARASPNGPQWHYAFARMAAHELRASRQGLQVWQAPPLSWKESLDQSRRAPYTNFNMRPDAGNP